MKRFVCTLLTVCLWSGHANFAQQVSAKPIIAAPASDPASKPPAPAQPASGPITVAPDYIIGADDSLKVDVWKEPQLSTTLPVRPDGQITLPLINDIQAAGFTPMQLEADITQRLKKFITDPVVSVSVLSVQSKRIFFVGEVTRSGQMQMTPGMTLLQAIASAGLTAYANPKKIYIWRGDPAHQKKIPFDYNKAIKKGDMQGVTLMSGDTIVVP
jgi:polysaccharide export outer membrane protein